MTTRGSASGRLFRFGWEHRLRDDPAVGGLAQEVLFVMATFADPDGTLSLTEERVAQCITKDVRTARRGLTAALESGYVERLTRGHNVPGKQPVPSRYRLVIPEVQAIERGVDAVDAVGVSEDGQPDTGDRLRVVEDGAGGAERTG